jgi:branched-chain amino acid transport system ATP-binding protein
MDCALEVRGLHRRFGALHVTDDVSLSLPTGCRHALIGPNGAGKTTLINLLTGVLAPSAGQILLGGRDITTLSRDRRVQLGLVRTFQINQLFPAMTPLEAVTLTVTRRLGLTRRWWRPLGRYDQAVQEAVEILRRFDLVPIMSTPTAGLSYGKQRLLEIAIAIACGPRVLLLDEPAAGVPETEREEILAAIAALPADVAVLLIEHDMDLVFRFAERIAVLVDGKLLLEGSAATVAADPRVHAVYLGEGDQAFSPQENEPAHG